MEVRGLAASALADFKGRVWESGEGEGKTRQEGGRGEEDETGRREGSSNGRQGRGLSTFTRSQLGRATYGPIPIMRHSTSWKRRNHGDDEQVSGSRGAPRARGLRAAQVKRSIVG